MTAHDVVGLYYYVEISVTLITFLCTTAALRLSTWKCRSDKSKRHFQVLSFVNLSWEKQA